MKSARRRFSASGICLARIASNFSVVMPGRASTRARCTSGGAETTTTASTRLSPPVSNSSGMSSTATFSPRRRRLGEEPPLGLPHQRMDDRLEPLERRGIVEHARGKPVAIDLAARGPGNAASIAATASPS